VVDWATSVVSNGKVKQLIREGQQAPENAILDQHGKVTRDPREFVSHLPMGGHKGYGLALVTELFAAYGGSSLPTIRCHPEKAPADEKTTPHFFFMVIHPEAISPDDFALGRDRDTNVQAVIHDILGHGNAPPIGSAILPGQPEHEAAQWSKRAGGLLFTEAEVAALAEHAQATGIDLDIDALKQFEINQEPSTASS
jgi:L-2-hydroxycarboxylate dehydrogenase (NAD+)